MLPVFFPIPRYTSTPARQDTIPLHELCKLAGVSCRASGKWIERPICLQKDTTGGIGQIFCEPGNTGTVTLFVPSNYAETEQDMARWGLGAMAYSVFDLVARESIKNALWRKE